MPQKFVLIAGALDGIGVVGDIEGDSVDGTAATNDGDVGELDTVGGAVDGGLHKKSR